MPPKKKADDAGGPGPRTTSGRNKRSRTSTTMPAPRALPAVDSSESPLASKSSQSPPSATPKSLPIKPKTTRTPSKNPDQLRFKVPLSTIQFLQSAKETEMWKGKCRMFWNQFFLIHHHASTNEQSMLFDQLLPNRRLSHKHELFVYFERTHSNNQNYLYHKVRQYGEHFLNETASGKAWHSKLKSVNHGG